MNHARKSLLATLMLALVPLSLFAHHGTAGTYDQTQVIRVTGVVKLFRWRNPHCALVLAAKDESGNEVTYAFEIGSPGALNGRGFSRDTFKVGDTVSFDMHPSYNNPHVGQPATRTFIINGVEVSGISGADE